MTDKELIKQEIERLYKHYLDAQEFDSGYNTALDNILQFIDSLPEEPASEDLEEELHNFLFEHGPMATLERCAKHFAEWQKQIDDKHIGDLQWEAYLKGEQDTKQQMMKDAVDGEYWDGSIYLDNRPTEYKDGDKVKIIIVKTEQQ